jgi:phosphoribosyl-dephospho-CoA transferase
MCFALHKWEAGILWDIGFMIAKVNILDRKPYPSSLRKCPQ